MDCRKNEKIAALLTVALCVVLALCTGKHLLPDMALCTGCTWRARMLYPFFHASVLHAAINGYVLLAVVFRYDITMVRLLLAYAVAATVPVQTLASIAPAFHVPTVGLSGVVFFLLASVSFQVQRKAYFQKWMAFYLLTAFFIPGSNAPLHLYAYLCGLFVALLQKPIKRK